MCNHCGMWCESGAELHKRHLLVCPKNPANKKAKPEPGPPALSLAKQTASEEAPSEESPDFWPAFIDLAKSIK